MLFTFQQNRAGERGKRREKKKRDERTTEHKINFERI